MFFFFTRIKNLFDKKLSIDNNGIVTDNRKVFLSYCTTDTPIVETIKKFLIQNNIEISQYTEVKYKESFVNFMNSIQKHQFALCIVSDGYLKSPYCMYEVGEFIQRSDYKDKLLFVVLNKQDRCFYDSENERYKLTAADVYNGFDSKIKYIKYWQAVYQKQKKELKNLKSFRARKQLKQDLNKTKRIYEKDISVFIDYLSEYNGKSFSELYENKFKELLNYILPNEYYDKIFRECDSFNSLLYSSIEEITKITHTDYTQVILNLKINAHTSGLIVVADHIPSYKQKYRLVDTNGIIGDTFYKSKINCIGNAKESTTYFCAVCETQSELSIPISILGKTVGVINSESNHLEYYNEKIIIQLTNLSVGLAKRLNELGYSPEMSINSFKYVSI